MDQAPRSRARRADDLVPARRRGGRAGPALVQPPRASRALGGDRGHLLPARDRGAAAGGHPVLARRAARLGRSRVRSEPGHRDAPVDAHPVPRRGALGARHARLHRVPARGARDGPRLPAARRRAPRRPARGRGRRRRARRGAVGLAREQLAGARRPRLHGAARRLPARRPHPARRDGVGGRDRRGRPARGPRAGAARRRRPPAHRLRGDRALGVQDGRGELQLVARLRPAELAADRSRAAAHQDRSRGVLEGDEPRRVRRRPLDHRRRPLAAERRLLRGARRARLLAPADPRHGPRPAHDAGHRRGDHAVGGELAPARARIRPRALRDRGRPAHLRPGLHGRGVRAGTEPPCPGRRADDLPALQPGVPEHGAADAGRRPAVGRRDRELPGLALLPAGPVLALGVGPGTRAGPPAVPPRRGRRHRGPGGLALRAHVGAEPAAEGRSHDAGGVRPARPGVPLGRLRLHGDAAGLRHPARHVPVRGEGRLLPAVLRGDGAPAAHGGHPGTDRRRLLTGHPRRQARRDGRPRRRRALVGRGLLPRHRVGHLRSDAGGLARPRPRRRGGGRRRRRRGHHGRTDARRLRGSPVPGRPHGRRRRDDHRRRRAAAGARRCCW